jgi:phage shock protein E
MGFLRSLFGMGPSIDFQTIINNGAIIYDVRSVGEFESGHNSRSKNLPLGKVKHQIAKIKKLNKPVIVCCRSGARSGQAKSILKENNIEAYNIGRWQNLNKYEV